jgi:hypothetical protein
MPGPKIGLFRAGGGNEHGQLKPPNLAKCWVSEDQWPARVRPRNSGRATGKGPNNGTLARAAERPNTPAMRKMWQTLRWALSRSSEAMTATPGRISGAFLQRLEVRSSGILPR